MTKSFLQEANEVLEKCLRGEAIEADWNKLEHMWQDSGLKGVDTSWEELKILKHNALVRDGTLSLKRLRGEVSKWIYFEFLAEDGVPNTWCIEGDIAHHIQNLIAKGITYQDIGASPEDIKIIEKHAAKYELVMHKLLSSGKELEITESRKSAVKKGKHYILHVVGDPELTRLEKQELLGLAHDIAEVSASEIGRYRIAMNGPKQQGNKEAAPFTHIHIICPAEDDDLPRLTSMVIAQ